MSSRKTEASATFRSSPVVAKCNLTWCFFDNHLQGWTGLKTAPTTMTTRTMKRTQIDSFLSRTPGGHTMGQRLEMHNVHQRNFNHFLTLSLTVAAALLPQQAGRRRRLHQENAAAEALLVPPGEIQTHVQAGEGQHSPKEISIRLPQSPAARRQQEPGQRRAAHPGIARCLSKLTKVISPL